VLGLMRVALLLMMLVSIGASPAGADVVIDVGGRIVNVHVPASYQPANPAAVVVFLHAYGSSGSPGGEYLGLEARSDELGFLYLHPEGTTDCMGEQFWNATDACCDFCSSTVDDVAFLSAVLDEVEAQLSVDPTRIYMIGHSNGGFMAYRMACELADRIAAVASLAGATWLDPQSCSPSEPVHILQIHGTLDSTILYDGGLLQGVPYPGAVETTEMWATDNGCSLVPDGSSPNMDLDNLVPGDETTVSRYVADCAPGGSAELWTIVGGSHIPDPSIQFSPSVVAHLLAHPKPPPEVPALGDPILLAAVLMAAGVASALASSRPRIS
jgi:polyhydroxybutyrate depolymerase